MTQQSADVSVTVVVTPFTAFIGSLVKFWQTQDPYAFMLGVSMGVSILLVLLIIYLKRKT